MRRCVAVSLLAFVCLLGLSVQAFGGQAGPLPSVSDEELWAGADEAVLEALQNSRLPALSSAQFQREDLKASLAVIAGQSVTEELGVEPREGRLGFAELPKSLVDGEPGPVTQALSELAGYRPLASVSQGWLEAVKNDR